jgi:hypothetical protein
VYVADARTEALPLVGGGEHDWAYLLGRLGWLKFDQIISHDIWFLGVITYIGAIAGGLMFLPERTFLAIKDQAEPAL